MSEYVGKFTLKDATKLHKGDPQPHDIHGTDKVSKDDYSGGLSAKNKAGLEKYTVAPDADPTRKKVRWS
jgi:hypothetical protein